MNDQLDIAIRSALRDIVAAAPNADRQPTPVNLVDEVNEPHRGRIYIAVAAAIAITFVMAGILSSESKRSGPDSTPSGRESGAITDPRAIDFSPWLINAPEWPGIDVPEYLVFDVAALDGWTIGSEAGAHPIAHDANYVPNYVWGVDVTDPEGRRFSIVITNSSLFSRVVDGETVDINGAAGIATDGTGTGRASSGEVSWPVADRHIATVTALGTIGDERPGIERVVALARRLTTKTVSTISNGGIGQAPEIAADSSAPFAGLVDGYMWSASATSDSMTFIVDQTFSETYSPLTDASQFGAINQFGNNDLCVFVAGYLPDASHEVRLVLSDKTTIELPTRLLEDGQSWFAACVPYALDATAVEVGSSNAEPVLHQLNWPLLRPTTGHAATDTFPNTEALARSLLSEQSANLGCDTTFAEQAVMVASTTRADGNRLELWFAPTSTDFSSLLLIAVAHNGTLLTPSGSCGDTERNSGFFSYRTEEHSLRFIDMVGRTDPNATRAVVTFSSGKFVLVDVQTDGFWILSIIDDEDYGQYKSVEPID